MNKQIASANKIVSFGEFKRNFLMHEERIKFAKPTLTTRLQPKINLGHRTARQPFGNTFNRTIDIELENKALLKKLTQKNKQPRGGLFQDSTNIKLVKNNRKQYYEQHERRLENEGLLRRLKDTKTRYKMETYISERKVNEKYINSISKFGLKGYKPNKTIVKFQVKDSEKQRHLQEKKSRIKQIQNINASRALNVKTSDVVNYPNRNPRFLDKVKLQREQSENNEIDMRASHTSRYKNSQRSLSHSHSGSINDPILGIIEERKIKINKNFYKIQGKEKANSVCLEITQIKKESSTDRQQFKHEVEISKEIYLRKFRGDIELLIQSIKLNEKNGCFYIK